MQRLLLALVILTLFPTSLLAQPQLSELERLKIENLNLKIQLSQASAKAEQFEGDLAMCQLAASAPDVTKAAGQLVAEIEAAHPGYTFDPQSGAFLPKPPE